MTVLHLQVLGPPLGKGAAVTSRTSGATYNPTSTAEWMASARHEVVGQLACGWAPLDEPAVVFITAVFRRPKTGPNAFKKRDRANDSRTCYAQKPDADNISKIVLDSLTHAGVWRDDAIADVHVRRCWQSLDGADVPRVEVLIVWGADLARLPWPPDALEEW